MLNDQINFSEPSQFEAIWTDTLAQQFGQPSDKQTGSLLRTLVSTKPGGLFLELGTGTGMSACWMLDGMDAKARLITVDNDEKPLSVARTYLGSDPRLTIHCDLGETIIDQFAPASVDLIFADSWPGKYNHLTETLALLKPGGVYVIDDMLPQPNWPEGHSDKADRLLETLEADETLTLTKFNWSTGIIIAVKK